MRVPALWLLGDNTEGQLGLDLTQRRALLRPERALLAPERVVAIAAGAAHSLLVDAAGNVYATGSALHSQTGQSQRVSHWSPLAFSGVAIRVVCAVAAQAHSLLLDTEGRVWACGSATHAQLGYSTPRAAEATPRELTALNNSSTGGGPVTQLSSMFLHSLAVTATGQLWAWGDNSLGQLGDGSQDAAVMPQQVRVAAVVAASAGATHSLALTRDGRVWGWGSNRHGQLGGVAARLVLAPVELTTVAGALAPDERIVSVHAALEYSLLLTSRGRVLGAGQNAQGQLGTRPASCSSPLSPLSVGTGTARLLERTWVAVSESLPPIVSLSVGARHTLALSAAGEVRAIWQQLRWR